MPNFPGLNLESSLEVAPLRPGAVAANMVPPAIPAAITGIDGQIKEIVEGTSAVGSPSSPSSVNVAGLCMDSIAVDWVNRVHVIPRRVDYGNILGTVVNTIDIFSAYIDQDISFTSFVNNAGTGISITDLPGLPVVLEPSEGLTLTLQATTEGSPQFDTTLDFVFDVGAVLMPITGQRVVMFPYRPEAPVEETLGFLTDILEHQDGSEQRIALRKNPRQSFQLNFLREEGVERSRIDMLMFDWQARIFGLPVWHEAMILSQDQSATDTVLNVDTTDYADLRVGSIVLIVKPDEVTFDAIAVGSFTSTTITLTSGLAFAYDAGTEVFPVRTALTGQTFKGTRFPKGAGTFEINFRVTDNDSDLADTSAFNTFDSLVLLDDKNYVEDTLSESYERRMVENDAKRGLFVHDSSWSRNRRGSFKTFRTNSRQELWETRRLLHALRGRQVPFWLPTFFKELTPIAALASGTDTMTITNIGYTKFVENRAPKNVIRITKTDGTTLTRTITVSAEIDINSETLTVDSTWPSTIAVADIDTIDLYEKVRIDKDEIKILHEDAVGEAVIKFPVKVVFE